MASMRLRFLVPLFSLFFVLCASAPASAATGPGDLIKLQDDGNLDTTADSAVYYAGTDGKRYAFPNAQAYFTWYADFSRVKIVSASEMASYQLGGNITYRPGTRLVKITSDPHVYAVEPSGMLRWVQTESVATALYGPDWNKRIDDISDAFFTNYAIGEPLAAAVYPSGTIVKRTADGAVFRIEDRAKRRIVSMDVFDALRIQDSFMLSTSSDLADYPDAADITAAEPAITDTAQKNLVTIPSIPTFTAKPPATSYFAVGNDATPLELHVASRKQVNVTRLTVKFEATTNNPADANFDDDKGGLVYQDNAQPNFTLIRFKDQSGAEPFGRKDLALDVRQDQSQTFVFDGSFTVPAGTEKILYFTAKTNTLLPTGEGYKVTLVVDGTTVVDADTGSPATFAPATDLAGPTLTSLNAAMEVTSSPSVPGSKTYVRGATGADIAGLRFKATTVAPNTITSVTFQGYVDEEGIGGFLPGADSDNGSETRVRDMLPEVSLYDGAGAKVAGPVAVSLEGKASFTGFAYAVAAGQTAALVVRGDISKTVELENSPNKVSFDVTDASTDVSVVDDKGAKVNVHGQNPDGGVTPTFYTTIKKNGTVGWAWAGNGGAGVAGREVFLGTLAADVKDDAYDLKTLTFRQSAAAAKSLVRVRLEYPTTGTGKASVSQDFIGTSATFANLPIVLPRDKRTEMSLYGTFISRDAGAVNGEQVKVLYDAAGGIQFVSESDGTSFDAQAFGNPDFAMGANTPSAMTVRFTDLAFAQAAGGPSGAVYRNATAEVLRFTAKAGPEGPARIRKLTFKVTPADAGKPGSNNDALERWADVNGDFQDDDGIVNLKQFTAGSPILLGEDSSTHIMYSVVHAGTKTAEPSTIDSTAGDYGLIEYAFNEGSELSVPAGITVTYSLELDVTKLDSANEYGLAVDLLGAADLQWTDVPSGTYAALTGIQATGLPFAIQLTVKQ